MQLMRTRNEKAVEERLVQGVRRLGGDAYKWVSPGQDGVPDRIVIMPGGYVSFVELKDEHGKVSPRQVIQHKKLRNLGAEVMTLFGYDDVDWFLERIAERDRMMHLAIGTRAFAQILKDEEEADEV